MSIVSDRNHRVTSKVWKVYQETFGAELRYSTTYDPQTGG